jgi:ABC-type multidrug transport system ATPase subunit
VLVTTHYMEEAQQCDRLVLMAAGRVAAEGTVADVVAGRTVVQVTAASWSEAFAALGDAGHDVMLAGRRIRVNAADISDVELALDRAGVVADLAVVPAILDEAMVAVSSGR